MARQYIGYKNNSTGQHLWGRVFHVSSVSRDEEEFGKYIKKQEKEDRKEINEFF